MAGFTAPAAIDLPHGFYEVPQQANITSEDDLAVIRYTIDGSPPTATSGEVYAGPIPIERTTTLRADNVPGAVSSAMPRPVQRTRETGVRRRTSTPRA